MSCERVLPGVLPADDAVEVRHHLHLEPVPRAPGAARRFVREHAPDLPAETGDALLLLTSELVSNAVLHARTELEVGLVVAEHSVVVVVHDLDLASRLQEPYAEREGGWGTNLVSALAQSWSSAPHAEGGKSVWFRLLREEAPHVLDGAAARDDADRRDR